MRFMHLHATQTANVYRPTATDDEGVEIPAADDTAEFTLKLAIAADHDAIEEGIYGPDVEEAVKLLSKDRTNILRPRDIVEVDMPGDRTGVRFEVESVNSTLVKTQQARAVRRAS